MVIKAFGGQLVLFLATAAVFFVPAGTMHYWQGWIFLAVYSGPSLAVTAYLMKNDPQLLARRTSGGPLAEKEPAQKRIMLFFSLTIVALFVVSGLDRRFGWSHLPPAVVLAGDALMLIGWLAVFVVFKENSFGAVTIELARDQRVITTGPYAWVRHPMYAGGLILLFGIPIVLGSLWGVLPFAATVPLLIWRLLDEEKFLARHLSGYTAYQHKVPYRLFPLVW